MDFKVGDKVAIKEGVRFDGVDFKKGEIGTVVEEGAYYIGVQWSFENYAFHDCDGNGKKKYSYYINVKELELYEDKKNNLRGW